MQRAKEISYHLNVGTTQITARDKHNETTKHPFTPSSFHLVPLRIVTKGTMKVSDGKQIIMNPRTTIRGFFLGFLRLTNDLNLYQF